MAKSPKSKVRKMVRQNVDSKKFKHFLDFFARLNFIATRPRSRHEFEGYNAAILLNKIQIQNWI